jgi:ferredoxin
MIARVLPGATETLDEDRLEMLEAAIDYCPVNALLLTL